MSIDLCLTDLSSREHSFYPICTAHRWRQDWEPTAKELGLEMIQCFPALNVAPEFVPRLIEELRTLKQSVTNERRDVYGLQMLETIDEIIGRIDGVPLDRFEISFG